MIISPQGIDLIKRFEGFKNIPYYCPAGVLTIGYGHAIRRNIEQFTPPISEQDASNLLNRDLNDVSKAIVSLVKVPLLQGQFDALCSLIYNWGIAKFAASKGLLLLNLGNYQDASTEFFSRQRGVVNIKGKFSLGLYNRRCAELKLWGEND